MTRAILAGWPFLDAPHPRDLTDEQWNFIGPFLSELARRKDGRGRPWRENRAAFIQPTERSNAGRGERDDHAGRRRRLLPALARVATEFECGAQRRVGLPTDLEADAELAPAPEM